MGQTVPEPDARPFDIEIRQLFEIEDFAEDTSKLDSSLRECLPNLRRADVRYDKRLYKGHRRTPAQNLKQ